MGVVSRMWRDSATLLVPAGLVAFVAAYCGLFSSAATQLIVTSALIKLVIVVGLFIFSGNSGIMSFGHLSFMAIGAYVCALLTIPILQKQFLFEDFPSAGSFILDLQINPVVAALVAGLLAAVFAGLVGIPLMRMSGFQASIATLALLIVVNVVISNWESVTHGTSTLIGVPAVATLWNTLAVAEGAIVVAYLYLRSGRGLRLRAAREDPYAASSLGISVVLERLVGFALSAFVVGVAGAMYAFSNPFSADTFYLTLTFYTIAVLVIGGQASLWGAVLGATLVSTFTEIMRVTETGMHVGGVRVTTPVGTTEVGLGLAMLIVLLVRPAGITGGREAVWPWIAVRRWQSGRRGRGGDDLPAVDELPGI